MTESGPNQIKVLLADDHNIVRQGIQFIVEDIIENPMILHASSLLQIKKHLVESQIDIAILDAQLPDGNCIEILPEIRNQLPEIRLLIFTSFDEENYSVKFINAGANGFLSKLSEESEIRNAIQSLVEKGEYFPPLTQSLLRISAYNPNILNPLHQLSDREMEIAGLYAKGLGNLEIANQLSIRQNTVSTYKKRIFEKLNITTLVELMELMRIHNRI
ncbi:MAG: response regulator transcription factor [Moheibacter sp.]